MLLATRMASRAAEHAYAADRFARAIVGFWEARRGALAAADRQPVGPLRIMLCIRCLPKRIRYRALVE